MFVYCKYKCTAAELICWDMTLERQENGVRMTANPKERHGKIMSVVTNKQPTLEEFFKLCFICILCKLVRLIIICSYDNNKPKYQSSPVSRQYHMTV
jgi:hypothetical protein